MRWYFDYISPYAYLQSTRLETLNQLQAVECIPVLFAGLLNHWENVGPAEIEPKRKWTFREITWLANRDGIALTLPPSHPFNPLPLLRLSIVHNNDIAVVQRLFNYVWAEGNTPQDTSAFKALLKELNTDESALRTDSVKAQLHAFGKEAINTRVFGVPTIALDQDLYWGYNATDMAISALTDPGTYPHEAITKADALPHGTGRTRPAIAPAETARASTPTTDRKTPRIDLKPIDLAEPADLVAAIRTRRGGELIELDRLLLYSRPLAEGWNHFIGNIREHFAVDQKLRELAMCTVAVINRAEYEFSQHAPLYIKAGGSEAKARLLRQPETAFSNPTFSEDEQLTIALTYQLTKDVHIDDALFNRANVFFGDEHLVELVATIAAYNMVSRFLVAFELHPH